jgi:lysophospholipase L1-like esterase
MSNVADGLIRKRSRKVWAKIVLAVLSLVATVLLAEGVARLLLPVQQLVEVESSTTRRSRPGPVEEREQERGIDVLIDWSGHEGVRLHPAVRATIHNHTLSHRDVVIETNSLGLRHPELGRKSDDEFRVLVLGDSITFGDYVPFEETYTAQLESRLDGSRPRVTVINAGLPGAGASDELYHYLEICDAVDADLILVGMYLNDAQSGGRFYARSLPEPYASSRFLSWLVNRVEVLRISLWSDEVIPEIDPGWREDFQGDRRLRTGDMWNDQDAFDFEIYNASMDFGIAWNPQSWVILERIMRTLTLAARQREQKIAAFLFPVHIQVKGTVEDFGPQRSFAAMCESIDLPCFDLVQALRVDWQADQTKLYFDHCHLTPHGNTVVAAALAEWLDEEHLIPR